jgi:DNA modification methylase
MKLRPKGRDHTACNGSSVGGQIVLMDIAALKLRDKNPRTHSKKQIEEIAASICHYGFVNPILIDEYDTVIVGHGRVAGAQVAGLRQVPTLRVTHLTKQQIRAYVIADNKLAEKAGWDRTILALELKELSLSLDFDVSVTGFETPEIDILLRELAGASPSPAIPKIDKLKPPVSQPGDVWHIGDHRVICGDARDPKAYQALLNGLKADCIFTDPPYDVAINGHVTGLGKVKHREFLMASGEMGSAEYLEFLSQSIRQLIVFSRNGSIHFLFMDWRHVSQLEQAAMQHYTELKNICVWVKTNAGMGSLYRSQHEMILVLKNGTAPHINNVELGKHGRNRTNVWTYAGANCFSETRDNDLSMHPTVKPIELVSDAILDVTNRGDIVLDAFAGSGTTLLAAHGIGRRGFGIELDPYYVDLIVSRFKDSFGLEAHCPITGQTWDEIATMRSRP